MRAGAHSEVLNSLGHTALCQDARSMGHVHDALDAEFLTGLCPRPQAWGLQLEERHTATSQHPTLWQGVNLIREDVLLILWADHHQSRLWDRLDARIACRSWMSRRWHQNLLHDLSAATLLRLIGILT